jgi:hypothetical protein
MEGGKAGGRDGRRSEISSVAWMVSAGLPGIGTARMVWGWLGPHLDGDRSRGLGAALSSQYLPIHRDSLAVAVP